MTANRMIFLVLAVTAMTFHVGTAFADIEDYYSYTSFVYPGSILTRANGINDLGQIVGEYAVFGSDYYSLYNRYGFLKDGNNIKSLGFGIHAYGINNHSQVVGYYEDNIGVYGFLLNKNSTTPIPIHYPGALETVAMGINDSMQIVGYYFSSSGAHGFLKDGNNYKFIHYPGSYETYARDINNLGHIVGYYRDKNSSYGHGFLYDGATYKSIDYDGINSNYGTYSFGINDSGQIVGSYQKLGERIKGFIYDKATYKTLNYQGFATDINNKREITGVTLGNEGFLGTPTKKVYGLFMGFNSSGDRKDIGGKDAQRVMQAFDNYYTVKNIPHDFISIIKEFIWNYDSVKKEYTGSGGINIKELFDAITTIKNKMQPGDTFMFFQSGHGTYHINPSKDPKTYEPKKYITISENWVQEPGTNIYVSYYADSRPREDDIKVDGITGIKKDSIAELKGINQYYWDRTTGKIYVYHQATALQPLPILKADPMSALCDEEIYLKLNPEKGDIQYLSDDSLANELSLMGPNISKVIMLGDCYSGGFKGREGTQNRDMLDLENIAFFASASEFRKGHIVLEEKDPNYLMSYFALALEKGLTKKGEFYLADGWTKTGLTGPRDGMVTFEELGFFIKSSSSIETWLNLKTGFKDDDEDNFFPSEPVVFTTDMWSPEFYKTDDFVDIVPLPGTVLLLGTGLLGLAGWRIRKG